MSGIPAYDVAIAGGGLAGASLAAGLADAGRRVAVIEPVAREADHQPSYDDRTLALNAASLNILDNLGVLDGELAGCPIRRIEITRAGGFGRLVLDAAESGREFFGKVLVARELGNRLLAVLDERAGITLRCPDRLESFTVDDDRVHIRLESGDRLTARVLVGADGTRSAVRRIAGIAHAEHDYRQAAMIFNVRPARAMADTAFERFTRDGPLALLPQPAGRLGVVWIDDRVAIDQALEWSDEELLERLERRAGGGFGGFAAPGRRAAYPLQRVQATTPIGARTVVIGNAANTLHPVSAQGFNLGLRDVAALLDVIAGRTDPGAPAILARYARARRDDHTETVRYTDTLARAFTNPTWPFRLGAAAGLAAHAFLPGLRRRLVHAAMGFRSPVSPRARNSSRNRPGTRA